MPGPSLRTGRLHVALPGGEIRHARYDFRDGGRLSILSHDDTCVQHVFLHPRTPMAMVEALAEGMLLLAAAQGEGSLVPAADAAHRARLWHSVNKAWSDLQVAYGALFEAWMQRRIDVAGECAMRHREAARRHGQAVREFNAMLPRRTPSHATTQAA